MKLTRKTEKETRKKKRSESQGQARVASRHNYTGQNRKVTESHMKRRKHVCNATKLAIVAEIVGTSKMEEVPEKRIGQQAPEKQHNTEGRTNQDRE